MKKAALMILTAFILTVGLFSAVASAERTEWTPVAICENANMGGDIFTITKWDIEGCYLLSDDMRYKKNLEFSVYGFFGDSAYVRGDMDFVLYCYDTAGNHIDTQYFNISVDGEDSSTYEYGRFVSLVVPDVTAAVEIAAKFPGSWKNTLYRCDYRNVWSDDGRVLAIPTLMLPVYETVGWHGDVVLWALDGRTIEVPYPDVPSYKQVGWYSYNDYLILNFRADYRRNLAARNYSAIMFDAESCLYELENTQYAAELYAAKTYAMDEWRKQVNAPIAVYDSNVYSSNGKSEIAITIRNVSYKTVKAFRMQFVCYDVFGRTEVREQEYYVENTWLMSAESNTYFWDKYSTGIEYISNPIITQVVYSDNTSWYK